MKRMFLLMAAAFSAVVALSSPVPALPKDDVVVITPPKTVPPVKVEKSTTTKPSPVGQPISDYKPPIKVRPTPPPPPPTPRKK